MILIIMGIAGSGKSQLGEALAKKLNWTFFEGDSFHPEANIKKMRSGTPLNDEDRAPWLDAIANKIKTLTAGKQDAIITCSALKKKYREILKTMNSEVNFIYIKGEKAFIEARMLDRKGHFMPVSLVESQLQALEEPSEDEAYRLFAEEEMEIKLKKVLNKFFK